MAAYGALVSVMQIMGQIHRHPHPPISIHKEQVESLTANVTFLQEFLEGYNPHVSYTAEADPLESRIAEAAYAAEDVIESYIVDQINLSVFTDQVEEISSIEFSQGLQKVIEGMDMIKMEITEKKMQGVQIMKKTTNDDAGSYRSSSKVTTMVGFDDVLYQMLEKLTGGERVRKIIPIVGMGGLGKTTLARNVYENPLIKERFHVRAWSTISQVHNAKKILSEILGQVDKQDKEEDLSENELGENLYKYLIGRRYLIVMDDIWSIEAWDRVRHYFPNNTHGSSIVITTRLSNLASQFNSSNSLEMKFLDEASSWNLFCEIVFGEEIYPPELEDIGKKIVEGCRGLPLSVVVVGGLLSKSEATRENWRVIEENLSSIVNAEDEGSCLQILYTSYNNLPVYIKPCFLYLGLFREDMNICVHILIQLWVAEGFIKPIDGKSLEEVAEEYIEELIDRNLILVEGLDHCGDVATFKVHDLVRDLALREGEKDRFLFSLMQRSSDYTEISQGIICTHRRIASSFYEEYPLNKLLESVEATDELSLAHILIGEFPKENPLNKFLRSVEARGELSLVRTLMGELPEETLSLPSFKLLRVYMVEEGRSNECNEEIFIWLLNLRYLVVCANYQTPSIPSYFWNLQTLYIEGSGGDDYCFLVIWKMPQLRVVRTKYAFFLPNPPLGGEEVVLENLHTLSKVANLKFSEEVLKRIPNIRKLHLYYYFDFEEEEEEEEDEEEEDFYDVEEDFYDVEEGGGGDYCLNNLHRLNKLQDLHIIWYHGRSQSMQELTLPYSLKQLTLYNTKLPWEEMASKIGCLPLLQVLKLREYAVIGSQWETIEGQFCALKFLQICNCHDLECWITYDNTHFPHLEHLDLYGLNMLGEIPLSIGDIPTLRSIELGKCSDSVVESARRIVEEQEELGNKDFHLQLK